jgi:DNA-directed RNA polymerase subunit K/omega
VSAIHRITRPGQLGIFEFCCPAALRAKQLGRGCLPKVEGQHKLAVTALREIETGKVTKVDPSADAGDVLRTNPALEYTGESR